MDCSTKTNEANRRAVLRILDQLLFNTPNGQPFCRPSRVAIVTPFEAQNQLYRAAVFLSLVHNIDPRHMPRVHTVDSIAGCSVYFLIVDIVITSTEEAYRFLE